MSSSVVPGNLLQAVASRRGRVALLVGAGCSVENPTGLKLSGEYAREVGRQLVDDGVLQRDELPDAEDLSELAEVVYARTGSKKQVVARLPREKFRNALPNSGYLDAVALMREGAIISVITLNYDLALTKALSELGANDIDVISGQDTMQRLGAKAVIYLHGNVENGDDDWILRKSELEDAWKDTWAELVTSRVATTPFLVFAGLGSPAPVLTESVTRIRRIVPDTLNVYLVDPDDKPAFSDLLSLPEGNTVQLTWCEFMTQLAKRLVSECCEAIRDAARQLCAEPGQTIEDGRFQDLVKCLQEAGLRTLGTMRAVWLATSASDPYYPDLEHSRVPMAQLLLALGEILVDPTQELKVMKDGRIRVSNERKRQGFVMGLHGVGLKSWAYAPRLLDEVTKGMSDPPDVVLATGFTGPSIEDLSPPESVVRDSDADDIVAATLTPRLFDIDVIRESGRRFEDLVA